METAAMKITSFWANGFRSLRDVRIEPLGSRAVFYGPNGSGKSNVVEAIDLLFRLVRHIGLSGTRRRLYVGLRHKQDHETQWAREFARKCAEEVLGSAPLLARSDVSHGASAIVLGANCDGVPPAGLGLGADRVTMSIELTLDWTVTEGPLLYLSQLAFDGAPAFEEFPPPPVLRLLAEQLPDAFTVVDPDRFPRSEKATASRPDDRTPILTHLAEGRLKNAFFVAQNSPDRAIRDRFRTLRRLLEGAPLHRPPFDAVQDPVTQEVNIREPLGTSDVSLERMGLGVAQIYSILGSIVLGGARSVAIEEPEAHLHAPTSGIALRTLLDRLVNEGVIDQLFIATHSNLFDLDPEGYWDFRVEAGATVVRRAPLSQIDRDHLYEPGPAKHALEQLLVYAPKDQIVFRRPDGAPITAAEMLEMLQRDDELAVGYLRALHGAALRIVRLDAERGGRT